MMKIIKAGGKDLYPTTTLNEIPVGTVFAGKVWHEGVKEYIPGVFYKASSSFINRDKNKTPIEVVVVALSGEYPVVWLHCREVRDYKVLDATLTVKESK